MKEEEEEERYFVFYYTDGVDIGYVFIISEGTGFPSFIEIENKVRSQSQSGTPVVITNFYEFYDPEDFHDAKQRPGDIPMNISLN